MPDYSLNTPPEIKRHRDYFNPVTNFPAGYFKAFYRCYRKNDIFIRPPGTYFPDKRNSRYDFTHGKGVYPYSLFFIMIFGKREGKPFLNPVVSNNG